MMETLSDVKEQYVSIIKDIEDGLVFDEQKLDFVTYVFWKKIKENEKENEYE